MEFPPWENPELVRFASEAVERKTDHLKLAEKLAKGPFAKWRGQILDTIALVPKYRKKFRTNAFLVCDKLAFEQSTAADIGTYKAKLFPSTGNIDDLCCGMGGDSFFLPKTATVRGYDLSPERIAMYRFNTKAMGTERPAEIGDVRKIENRGEYFTIDSARREVLGDNQRNFSELAPSLSEILEIAKRYRGGMAKLPPGYPTNEFPADAEIAYLGSKSDCRECLVLFGELAKRPGKIRAVAVDEENCPREWTSSEVRELPVETLGKFIAEPIPVLVRSHLFSEIAIESSPGAGLISPGIAYVTSAAPLDPSAFRNYEILGSAPISTGKVKGLLKAHDVGKITLKKRGVEIVPEAEIKRLSPKGSKEAVLFYTRVKGEKTAILAVPVKGNL